ncbi:hypothetical protein [Catenulispora rubra]|uniref:hypothetical protein n=1 Tax=Catenulispora rubra TaxID=280293 RepID=UPI0018926F31|nr:hypothetical protein [Catenulispora rubra]
MLIAPLDSTRDLLAIGPATPQVDRESGAHALERGTDVPLYDVSLVMPIDGGNPLTMRVTVPQPGLTEAVDMGTKVKAIGLTLVTDVKNGRAWYVYKASALKIVKG